MIPPIVSRGVCGYHTGATRTNTLGKVGGREDVGFGVCRNREALRMQQPVLKLPRVPFQLGRAELPFLWLGCRMG